ncbi:CIC11C00000003520 [Sungouiella intermedia]|uniref:CIC11C00000003520 n=1 Tax=Sungouiella intermedia TaxID=45354 RepID=A0A1L0C4Z1_9ASCO|nr:CIC11C00000003520 [[Candida] intermedia]
MKLSAVVATLLTVSATQAVAVQHSEATVTEIPENQLEKRFKDVIVAPEYKKQQDLKAGSSVASPTLKPWARTIYSTKVELVTPTVIAGVTFSAKPPTTTDGLEPWISLKKDGTPQTIKPKMKNGAIANRSPDYGTYFQTATTVLYNKEELKAHNMADDQIYEHVEYLPEDLTYQLLNPVLRCTPEGYRMRGLAKDLSPEPFCTPQDNNKLYLDKTYFVTWYTRFFGDEVTSVKLHLSYVKESARQKGLKRDTGFVDSLVEKSSDLMRSWKRSIVIEKGGQIEEKSFFVSEPIARDVGYFPLTVEDSWFGVKDYYRKVMVSLQPDTIPDEEFNHMSKYIIIEIAKGSKVAKGHQEDLKKIDEKNAKIASGEYEVIEGIDYEKYLIIISLPTCVILATFAMWIFVRINKRDTDLSFLKKVKFTKRKKNKPYSSATSTELPQWGPKRD